MHRQQEQDQNGSRTGNWLPVREPVGPLSLLLGLCEPSPNILSDFKQVQHSEVLSTLYRAHSAVSCPALAKSRTVDMIGRD